MTSDTFSLTHLQNQLKNLIYENNAYKLYITNLEKAFINLENDYTSIKYQYELNRTKESYIDNLKENIEFKNNRISNLEKEILIQKVKYKKYINEKEAIYEKDVEEAKRLGEISKTKIKNSEKLEKLNNLLFYKVKELEREIKKIKEEEKIKLDKKDKDFEERLKDMKARMMDFIKEVQNETNEKTNKKLKEKIDLIHKNSLLNELEFQSLQLEDLLKQRDHLDKIIMEMKNDIEIHKKVEKILIGKNKKYTNMIRHLSLKIDRSEINNYQEKKNIIINLSDNNKYLLNSTNTNDIYNNNLTQKTNKVNASQKNLFFSKINQIKNTPFNSDSELSRTYSQNNVNHILNNKKIINNKRNINIFQTYQKNSSMDNLSLLKSFHHKLKDKFNQPLNIASLQRELIKKLKDLEDYKSKYESYKSKLEYLNKKYINIINMFDEALEKIYNEKDNNKFNEIFIDIEEIKKCDFDKLTSEQKYSIVTLLIKYLLPLINEDNLPDKLKNNIKKINTKIYFNNSVFSNNNSMSTTINGKVHNNSTKNKKIIEFVDENSQKCNKFFNSKSTKKLIHNLNIEGYHSYSIDSKFNLIKFSTNTNYNFNKKFFQSVPPINKKS